MDTEELLILAGVGAVGYYLYQRQQKPPPPPSPPPPPPPQDDPFKPVTPGLFPISKIFPPLTPSLGLVFPAESLGPSPFQPVMTGKSTHLIMDCQKQSEANGQINVKTNPIPLVINKTQGWVIIPHPNPNHTGLPDLFVGGLGRCRR